MSMTTSPTREETSKFQGRRRKMEVPCSEVPLGSLARFCDDCRLWEINSRVRNPRMNRMEQVSLSWGMLAELLGMQCGPLCSSIFPKCLVKRSFSCSLDTKFCLHAAGGIYVYDNFANSGGKIDIAGSSANEYGGAVLRSSSLGLWQDFEMGVGLWEINSGV